MSDCTDDCDLAEICAQRHWSIYGLIIAASLTMVLGRIFASGYSLANGEITTMYSANDRSRWATVESLVDYGTYEIDYVIDNPENKIPRDTIDKVKHLNQRGEMRSYSSKPTLFPTLVAGIYWCVSSVANISLQQQPVIACRVVLAIVSGFAWLLFLRVLCLTLERIQIRDWGRYFIATVAGFGTFLSSFTTTLNNHVPAAVAVMFAIYGLLQIMNYNRIGWRIYGMTGFAAAFAASVELPALSFFGIAAILCLLESPKNFLIGFLPGCTLVAVGFFGTNYLAHQDFSPAYAHKGDGAVAEVIFTDGAGAALDRNEIPDSISQALTSLKLKQYKIERVHWPFEDEADVKRWKVSQGNIPRFTIVNRPGSRQYEICRWDNWYDYPGSYWISDKKAQIDRGEADSSLYLFHVLFGHHGIFSLTPIWLFSFAGMFALLFPGSLRLHWFGAMTIVLTCTVIGFYVFYLPAHDRNYGGFTSVFRWALWLVPFWLISLAPVVDWLSKSTRGRMVCYFALLVSGLSAMYSAQNPWIHPWLYCLWEYTNLPI